MRPVLPRPRRGYTDGMAERHAAPEPEPAETGHGLAIGQLQERRGPALDLQLGDESIDSFCG